MAMAAPQHGNQMRTHGLVDFGNPAVVAWMKGMFDRMLSANHVDWIRWDFNMDPRMYWEVRDGPERRGLSQIRHVQGVYEVLDWLRQRFPNLFVDGCSSGGRRIDLGWLRRAHSYFSSDHSRHTDIVRNHLSGGSRFLPANWLETNLTRPARDGGEAGPLYDEADYPDTAFHSHFAGTFGISDDVAEWTPEHRARARRHLAVYKQLRQYLAGDFYPLFPLPSSLAAWDGWQFHDPATGEGFFAAFRLRSGEGERRLRLRGLDPARAYAVVDPYAGDTATTLDGATLVGEGLPVSLPRNGSVVRTYRPV
jgi:alpha-galactosidase